MSTENIEYPSARPIVERHIEPSTEHVHELPILNDRLIVHTDIPAAISISVFTADDRFICRKAMSASMWIAPVDGKDGVKVHVSNESDNKKVRYTLMTLAHYLESVHPYLNAAKGV